MSQARRTRPLPTTQPLVWRVLRRFLFGRSTLEERLWYLPLPFIIVAVGLFIFSPRPEGSLSRGLYLEHLLLVGAGFATLRLCYNLHTRFTGGKRKLSVLLQVFVGLAVIWGSWHALTAQGPLDAASIISEANANSTPNADEMAGMGPEQTSQVMWLWVFPIVFGIMFAVPITLSTPLVFLFVSELFDTSAVVKWLGIGLITVIGAVAAIYLYVPEELPGRVWVIGLPLLLFAYAGLCVLTAGVKDTRMLSKMNRWFEALHAVGQAASLAAVGAVLWLLTPPLQDLFRKYPVTGYVLVVCFIAYSALNIAATLVTLDKRRARVLRWQPVVTHALMAFGLFLLAYSQWHSKDWLSVWLSIGVGVYCVIQVLLSLRSER